MRSFADRLYRRSGASFGWAVIAFSYLLLVGLVITPATAFGAIWAELGLVQWAAICAAASSLGALGVLLGTIDMRRSTLGILNRWIAGDHTDPAAAWEAVHKLPVQGVLRSAVSTTLLAFAVFVPLAGRWSGARAAWEYAAVAGTVAITLFTGGALVIVGMTVLLRPLAVEIGDRLPQEIDHRSRGLNVRTRMLLGVAISAVPTGLYTAASASRADSLMGQVAVSIIVATATGGFVVVVFDRAYLATISTPLRALTDATERVAAGDFGQLAPLASADELGELTASFNRMQQGLEERERLRSAFGSYVDPLLAERLLRDGSDLFGGESVPATVLFADIVGFTPYAEQHDAQVVVRRLNELFQIILPVIAEHRGHINRFLGDGVLAVFGVPEQLERHADAGVAAAVLIQQKVSASFGDELRLGIGINTGPVIAGTIGSADKLEFSLVGDAVNVAARVEALTRSTGDAILLTEDTLAALVSPPLTQNRGAHELKGRASPVVVHAVDAWAN